MGCRNTVFNAQAQSGAEYVPQLAAAGVGCIRVELVDEPPEAVAPLLEGYRAVVAGERTAKALMDWMQTLPNSNGARFSLCFFFLFPPCNFACRYVREHGCLLGCKECGVPHVIFLFAALLRTLCACIAGRPQGVTRGSLETKVELSKESLKPTAANLKAAQQAEGKRGSSSSAQQQGGGRGAGAPGKKAGSAAGGTGSAATLNPRREVAKPSSSSRSKGGERGGGAEGQKKQGRGAR